MVLISWNNVGRMFCYPYIYIFMFLYCNCPGKSMCRDINQESVKRNDRNEGWVPTVIGHPRNRLCLKREKKISRLTKKLKMVFNATTLLTMKALFLVLEVHSTERTKTTFIYKWKKANHSINIFWNELSSAAKIYLKIFIIALIFHQIV